MYKLLKTKYYDNRLNISVESDEYPGEIYASLTTNLEDNKKLNPNMAYLDVNNSKEFIYLLEDKYTIVGYQQSGFVTYPLVEIDEEFLKGIKELN